MGTSLKFRFLLFVCLIPIVAFAGTTGKIAGKVLDKETGQVLPGANVFVEDTNFGAATDLEGNYTILMVPPGTYTVRATMMGYNKVVYEHVKVSIDLTTKLKFELSSTILEMGEEVVVVADKPMVQMDLTSTSAIIGAETIENLPVDHFEDVVNLQAGVVEGHFRGGRSGEVMYMIDGLPVNDVYSGSYAFQVENSAIAELEVISGTFNAEYGQAMSGIVNIVTKDGGERYSGEVSTYIGDYISNHRDIFWNVDKFNPTYNFEASLNGPVPFTSNRLTFYINGRWFKEDGYIYGKDVFKPSDHSVFRAGEKWVIMSHGKTYDYSPEVAAKLIADADPVPMRPVERTTSLLKLTYKLSGVDKLSYELLLQDDFHKEYDHQFRLNPEGAYKHFSNGYNNSLIWTHVFSERTFLTAKFNNFFTKYQQYVYEDPYDPRYVSTDRLQDSGANAFHSGGMQMWNFQRSTNTTTAKLDMTSQVNNRHQLKLGLEGKRHQLWLHEFEILTDGTARIAAKSTFSNNEYYRYPRELAIYFQDKMEFDNLIVNAGMRYDYFDPRGDVLVDFTNVNASSSEKVATTSQVSPRLGLAYPITDKGVIHISYGHFFQVPNFDYLYKNPENDIYPLQSTLTPPPNSELNTLGNAALKPQKTVMYEIGLQQQLTDDFALDITAYRRDIRNLLGTEVHRLGTGIYYARYINRDYAGVKGVTISLEKRQRTGISGVGATIDYTFQVAKGNASDPTDAFLNTKDGKETLKQMRPLDWDRQHQLNASLTIGNPDNYSVSVIGRLATGFPYTSVYGTGAYIENNSQRPFIYTFDTYFYKKFRFGRLNYATFIRIYNLFDRLNELDVFPDTGRAGYSLIPFQNAYVQPQGINTMEDYYIRPDFYSAPREIQVGLSVEF